MDAVTEPARTEPARTSQSLALSLPALLRDISRGGLAAVVAGFLVGGLGGRIVMRLAALADPDSVGRRTENGNRIGDITLDGTLAQFIFGGMLAAMTAAVVWVVVRPWLPAAGWQRALLAMPIAIGLGGILVVQGSNPDFQVLEPDEPVILLLLLMVGLIGAVTSIVDDALERRLPAAHSRGALAFYIGLEAVGLLLALPIALGAYFSAGPLRPAPIPVGIALLVVGLATAAWWVARMNGRDSMLPALRVVGRSALVVAVVLGGIRLAQEASLAIRI